MCEFITKCEELLRFISDYVSRIRYIGISYAFNAYGWPGFLLFLAPFQDETLAQK